MIGIVKKIKGKFAELSCATDEFCSSEKHCGACGVFIKRRPKNANVLAKNLINAQIGDKVNFEIETGGVLKSSVLLLLCPVLIFLILCMVLEPYIGVALSFACGIISCAIFYFVSRYFLKNKTYYVINSFMKD